MTEAHAEAPVVEWLVSVLFRLEQADVVELERLQQRLAHLEPDTGFLGDDEVVIHLRVRARSAEAARRYVESILHSHGPSDWWNVSADADPV